MFKHFWQFPEKYKNNKAVIYLTEDQQYQTLTYQQLDELCIEFAKKLNEASRAKSNSLVCLFCKNDLNTLVAYLSCLRNGCPMILVDGNKTQGETVALIDAFAVVLLLKGGEVIHVEGSAGDKSTSQNIDARLALMISTSGSTGSAKQVALSYDNLVKNAEAICQYLPISNDDVTMTTLPFQYSYGLSVINTHLMKGACILLNEEPVTSRGFWNLLQDYSVTSLAGVPHTYEMLKRLGFLKKELPALRYVTQAGGRLADKLVKVFSETFAANDKAFFIMYGQTEATARMAWLDPVKLPQKSGSIGKAIPGGEFCLQDELQQTITDSGISGELVYRGPNIMLGYASSSEDIEQFFPSDVLLTGDMAIRDDDGDYFIVGRIKRFVKIFGQRINLDEVEQLLEKRDFSAKAVGTDKRLYLAVSRQEDETNVIQCLSKSIGLHPSVIRASFVASLPLKTNQKIDYSALLAHFEADAKGR